MNEKLVTRRRRLWRFSLILVCLSVLLFLSSALADNRALLVGCDQFVSGLDTSPSSRNNVSAMAEALSGGGLNMDVLVTRRYGVPGAQELTDLILETFSEASEHDVSYFYLSTHGLWEPGEPGSSMTLLLSDGKHESGITAAQLHKAFSQIPGTKVLIVDACHAGAMIAKGIRDEFSHLFEGDDFKVICSSGGAEESWFWRGSVETGGSVTGFGYFSDVLSAGISVRSGYAADANRDGEITLSELGRYLLAMHGASRVHTYPEDSDFVVMTYDVRAVQRQTDPVGNITFEEGLLDRENREISFSFTVYSPVRVAYQTVYQVRDRWDFEHANIVYDTDETFGTADTAGTLSPGLKERTVRLSDDAFSREGYVLFQMVVMQGDSVKIVASRAIGMSPVEPGKVSVEAKEAFCPRTGGEMGFVISHTGPALLTAVVENKKGETVRRLLSREPTRPEQLFAEGTTLYWDGRDAHGTAIAEGTYSLHVWVFQAGVVQEARSDEFRLTSAGDTEPEQTTTP